MRKLAATTFALVLILAGGPVLRPTPALAAPATIDGWWKLIVQAFGDDEFLIVDVATTAGKPTAKVIAAQKQVFGSLSRIDVATKGDQVTLTIRPEQGDPVTFEGTLGPDNKALGTLKLRGGRFPAMIVKTKSEELAPFGAGSAAGRMKLIQASNLQDPKAKIAALLAVIKENAGHPKNDNAYRALLDSAESAKLTAEEVRGYVDAWAAEAKPYGLGWSDEVRTRVVRILNGKKAYAAIATELALAAEKALPADASLDTRAELAQLIASSAKLSGDTANAARAESLTKEYDAKLDAEYHEKVPPFKPATYAGRKSAKADRTVVMEIFTGAECPPCVPADVGFDALMTTYKPTEFIGLQYHLHIPGPDPLTNPDTIGRQMYYGEEAQSTPTTFFNGKRDGGGGERGMAASKVKYDEYREVVDPALETQKQADITVSATREGDTVKILASAKALGSPGPRSKTKLRLVLIEPSVRYPGGNQLRFHHNVVRSLPGGFEGKPLDAGKGEIEATVKLSELRKSLSSYVDAYPSSPDGRSFSHPLPPINLENLAVVALVQDDADHAILHAVQVPVKTQTP